MPDGVVPVSGTERGHDTRPLRCRWFGHRWVRCHHCWTYLGNGYSSCIDCGAMHAGEHWHYPNDKPAPLSCRRCGEAPDVSR